METCDECKSLWGAFENAVFSLERAKSKVTSLGWNVVPTATMQAELDALDASAEAARRALRAHKSVSHSLVAHA